jgi:hypothetical protein
MGKNIIEPQSYISSCICLLVFFPLFLDLFVNAKGCTYVLDCNIVVFLEGIMKKTLRDCSHPYWETGVCASKDQTFLSAPFKLAP